MEGLKTYLRRFYTATECAHDLWSLSLAFCPCSSPLVGRCCSFLIFVREICFSHERILTVDVVFVAEVEVTFVVDVDFEVFDDLDVVFDVVFDVDVVVDVCLFATTAVVQAAGETG